jgi:hypothetical protein
MTTFLYIFRKIQFSISHLRNSRHNNDYELFSLIFYKKILYTITDQIKFNILLICHKMIYIHRTVVKDERQSCPCS